MYQYNTYDRQFVDARVAQYRDQVRRFRAGALTEEQFRPLRLQNGLYMQRQAHMLRVAIPYGHLSTLQMRRLADIADRFDKGYGHFTTRQNIQYNWINLDETPDILQALAEVEMHAIQTSGNCVRNITTDPWVGVARDEMVDTRPYAEMMRQWSSLHPEFSYLPRKFKIALTGAREDRAAIMLHDIGFAFYKLPHEEMNLNQPLAPEGVRIKVFVGGGMGRTPIIGAMIREDLQGEDLLTYCEAILRVYNRYGRRDNLYKARIKILVKALGVEAFTTEVEQEWQQIKDSPTRIPLEAFNRVAQYFVPPAYENMADMDFSELAQQHVDHPQWAAWLKHNVLPHRVPGYSMVLLSLKPHGTVAPGDATAQQMREVAHWADTFGFGEIRVTHEQNLLLPDIRQCDLFTLWQKVGQVGLATPNHRLLTDIIACPGGDFCALANARSLTVAAEVQKRFDDLDMLFDIGEISINISGCINSCAHHHIGNIGVLGVDKDGKEWYQVSLGGAQGYHAKIAKIIGPAFSAGDMPEVIARIIRVYLRMRIVPDTPEGAAHIEPFSETVSRIGIDPFKKEVYGAPLTNLGAADGKQIHHGGKRELMEERT